MEILQFGYGILAELPAIAKIIAVLATIQIFVLLGSSGARLWMWALVALVGLHLWGAPVWAGIGVALVALVFLLPPVRKQLSRLVMQTMERLQFLPKISSTEKEAIEAGTVWVEGELFSGKPDFKKILAKPFPDLTPDEQAFVDGPVQEVCDMTNDWEVFQNRDLSPGVWTYLKEQGFFGLIIPKEYGGHGFSPSANSAVVAKAATASPVLGISVMVPNSLGPAELLVHYGTQEQKDHYLPRLARGLDVPAFALTEPNAGSDAGAISASGVVFSNEEGDLFLRLNWRKRYITLAGISTVLGLAFKLEDPGNLLGMGESPGITCGLVPTVTEGVVIGNRHDPMGIPFWNCPTEGHNVILPLEETIIGGRDGVGKGWRMLMESLSVGRGISLPASSCGGIQYVARVASAHAVIRKQFGLSIGKFEGIEEPMARVGGLAYMTEAARRYTNGALDQGAKPAVVTAMMKYACTESLRKVMNDGMDILGGNAISRGPRNTLAHAYMNMPISITVEGANILTRTLMIFGQGAIRCHPYALKEMMALEARDIEAFDASFWKHIGHVIRNTFRSLSATVTRGMFIRTPVYSGPSRRYFQKLSWASASFAFLADIAMATLGGDLKRKEKLTGRFADVFSWMYLAAATLKRFEEEGRRKEDEPFLRQSMDHAFLEMQRAFDGLYKNMEVPGLSWLFRGPIAAWSRANPLSNGPSDKTGHQVARALMQPGEQRDRMTGRAHIAESRESPLGRLEYALNVVSKSDHIQRKLKTAIKEGVLQKAKPAELLGAAIHKGLITAEDARVMEEAEVVRNDAIQVDEFTPEEYFRTSTRPVRSGDGSGEAASFDRMPSPN